MAILDKDQRLISSRETIITIVGINPENGKASIVSKKQSRERGPCTLPKCQHENGQVFVRSRAESLLQPAGSWWRYASASLSRSSTLSERCRNDDDVTYAVMRVEKSNSQLPCSAKRCD
ncbi:hypothetical protein HZH68_008412 [Vespula germanica]|uniref:Uncharacterized protein n=1 Tax=Vespula germanica TaxID=30212 RepID=A0A834K4P6_VESGE|nr:hypothetical protein HZH68_008412 [Vespula germanica]